MKQLKIPVQRPTSFSFYGLSVNKGRLQNSRITSTTTYLTETKRADLLVNEIADEELSLVEKELLLRTESVLKIERPVEGDLLSSLKQTLEEALYLADQNPLLDMEQGPRLLLASMVDRTTPLSAATILRIRAQENERFELATRGLKRFGLPELSLSDIPPNLGADAAYLLRTIASYLIIRLDIAPAGENLYLSVGTNEEMKIPVYCCELDNPLFQTRDDYLPGLRISLKEDLEKNHYLEISEASGYEDKIDWFIDIVARLREVRSEIRWQEPTGLQYGVARSA